MRYRELGQTGLQVSEIGIGAWGIGGVMMIDGRPGSYGAADDAEAIRMIHWGLDQGINFIDSAPAYGFGHSEELVGQALKGRRDKVIVETKVGEHHVDGRQVWRFDPPFVREAIDQSLQRLQTDYIDSYVLHLPAAGGVSTEEALEAIETARDTGKVRFVGASIYSNAQGVELIESGRCDVIQQVVSLLQPEATQALLPAAIEHGVGIVARQVLFKGFLTDAVTRETVFAETDMRSRYPKDAVRGYFDRIDELSFLWSDGRRRRIEAAIQFALSQPAVGTVICGAVTQQELADAVAAGDAAALSDEEVARVADIQQRQLAAAIAR
ncbi:MAG: aldo/keto reductase [Chloroflexi bacterium]|nr:aldo/keto reductase [Chloroflexota bacterium]